MKVQILCPLHPDARASLEGNSYYEIIEKTEDVEALLIRSNTKVNESFLNQYKSLRYILTLTNGFDHIDFEALKTKDIALEFLPEANRQSAAELTWALLLCAIRHLHTAYPNLKKEVWRDSLARGRELYQKKLFLVGFGGIGKRVAKIAKAFSMPVMAFDPYLSEEEFAQEGVEQIGFEEGIKLADVISLHVPYHSSTHRMFQRLSFEHFHSEMIFVNTSRGNIVDEEDLYNFLKANPKAFAAMDVFAKEPLKNSKLIQLSNFLGSPHIGAHTEEAFRRGSIMAVESLFSFHSSGKMKNPLPPDAAWYKAEF